MTTRGYGKAACGRSNMRSPRVDRRSAVRRTTQIAAILSALFAAGVGFAPAAGAEGAEVLRPEGCGFGPDPETGQSTFPGVDALTPADSCHIVLLPRGGARFVIRAELPAEFSSLFDTAFVQRSSGGVTVVTPSGNIVSTGGF
jgi:hypothetical protein